MAVSQNQEKRYLKCILKKFDAKTNGDLKILLIKLSVWVISVISMFVLLQLHKRDLIEPIILVAASLFLGCIMGITIMLQNSNKYWSVLKVHIDRSSIADKVKELET